MIEEQTHSSSNTTILSAMDKSTENIAQSPYASQYKTPGTKNSQTIRRHELLKAIKERRHATIDEKRTISEVFNDVGDESFENPEEAMEVTIIKSKRKGKYADKLMLSEWLIEKPDDLEEKWLVKVCPKGVRNIVVAHKGRTKCFNKGGYFITEFVSQLPGGSPSSMPMKFTILDCIFAEHTGTYHVLDALVWNSYSVINSSTEFRFFFIESKMQECLTISQVCKGNKFKFSTLPYKPAQYSSIEETFNHFDSQVDGVLFYHSELSYLSETTPLVGWLKAFMLPEILGIPVHAEYLLEKPERYSNLLEYTRNYEKTKRKRATKIRDVEMLDESECDILN